VSSQNQLHVFSSTAPKIHRKYSTLNAFDPSVCVAFYWLSLPELLPTLPIMTKIKFDFLLWGPSENPLLVNYQPHMRNHSSCFGLQSHQSANSLFSKGSTSCMPNISSLFIQNAIGQALMETK
jgi:hypothetical protein